MNVNRKNDSMKKILVWGLLAVLGIACYDDLGNYDYNDINDMVLEMPRSVSVTIPKKDSVLVEVKAAVTQLDRKDNANFDLFVEKESKWGDVDGMWYGFGMPDMGLPEK